MEEKNKISRSLRTLPALTVATILCACIPIPYTRTYPLSLPTPAASLVQGSTTPHGAPTILVRGTVENESSKRVSPGEGSISAESVLAVLLLRFENMEFKPDRDVGDWARDGLANKLEAAGYRIQRIGKEDASVGPILVTIDVTGLSAKTTVAAGPPGIHVYFGANPPVKPATCSVELNATITILKQGGMVFSKSYRSSYTNTGATCGMYHGMYLEEGITKAFENLLSEAIPEVTASLSHAS